MGRGAAVMTFVVMLAACTRGDDDTSTASTSVAVSDVPSITVPVATAAVTVAATTPDGSNPVCLQLAADGSLTGLGEVIRSATTSGVAPDVSSAAASLDAVAGSFPSAAPAAAALRAWAPVPGDPAALDALAAAFSSLDAEVQATCQFPLS